MNISYFKVNFLAFWWQLLICIIVPNAIGIVTAAPSDVGPTGWYASLKKPPFTPPNSIFLGMWIYLYTTMGIASFLVWRDGGGFTGKAGFSLRLYIFNLILNCTWTPVFFNARSIEAAAVVIVMLLTVILMCIFHFWEYNRFASLLLLPYALWISIATALNFALYRLNVVLGSPSMHN